MTALKMTLDHNGVTYETEIATIESTFLGVEHHGIFTANLALKGVNGGWGQGTGDYCLDGKPEQIGAEKRRVGSAYGLDHIMQILTTLGANSWESLKGANCLVLRSASFSQILGIADLGAKRVLIFRDHAELWSARDAVSS